AGQQGAAGRLEMQASGGSFASADLGQADSKSPASGFNDLKRYSRGARVQRRTEGAAEGRLEETGGRAVSASRVASAEICGVGVTVPTCDHADRRLRAEDSDRASVVPDCSAGSRANRAAWVSLLPAKQSRGTLEGSDVVARK